jgi:hypothetical protein
MMLCCQGASSSTPSSSSLHAGKIQYAHDDMTCQLENVNPLLELEQLHITCQFTAPQAVCCDNDQRMRWLQSTEQLCRDKQHAVCLCCATEQGAAPLFHLYSQCPRLLGDPQPLGQVLEGHLLQGAGNGAAGKTQQAGTSEQLAGVSVKPAHCSSPSAVVHYCKLLCVAYSCPHANIKLLSMTG